jgi:hypothetical protein
MPLVEIVLLRARIELEALHETPLDTPGQMIILQAMPEEAHEIGDEHPLVVFARKATAVG